MGQSQCASNTVSTECVEVPKNCTQQRGGRKVGCWEGGGGQWLNIAQPIELNSSGSCKKSLQDNLLRIDYLKADSDTNYFLPI